MLRRQICWRWPAQAVAAKGNALVYAYIRIIEIGGSARASNQGHPVWGTLQGGEACRRRAVKVPACAIREHQHVLRQRGA